LVLRLTGTVDVPLGTPLVTLPLLEPGCGKA
jgi:hypothetical protein